MRLTLQFIRIALVSTIQKTGNGVISPDPFEYPSKRSPASTGLAVRAYTRQIGRLSGGLRWKQVDAAMAGLQLALYAQGMFVEAHFVIYDDDSGLEVHPFGFVLYPVHSVFGVAGLALPIPCPGVLLNVVLQVPSCFQRAVLTSK